MSLDDFETAPEYDRPQKNSNTGCILAAIFGGVGGVVLLCCGCGSFLGYFGFEIIATDIQQQLNSTPDFVEVTGRITEVEYEFWDSLDIEDYDTHIVSFTGTKASGTLTGKTRDEVDGSTPLLRGTILLDDGRMFELEGDEMQPLD